MDLFAALLNTWYVLSHYLLKAILWNKYHCYNYFIHKETEAEGGWVTYPLSEQADILVALLKFCCLLSFSQSCFFIRQWRENVLESLLVLYKVSMNGCILQYTKIPKEKSELIYQTILCDVAIFYFSPSSLIIWIHSIMVVFNVRCLDALGVGGASPNLYIKMM